MQAQRKSEDKPSMDQSYPSNDQRNVQNSEPRPCPGLTVGIDWFQVLDAKPPTKKMCCVFGLSNVLILIDSKRGSIFCAHDLAANKLPIGNPRTMIQAD